MSEFNEAEAEAEKILQNAFDRIQDGEDCPAGDDCPVHHRVDNELIDDKQEYGRIITYVGDYVVISSDNPQLESPAFLLAIVLGKITKDDIPPMYETCVVKVGSGTLYDLQTKDREAQLDSVRFVQFHDEWDNFRAAHEGIVAFVKEGILDLSKPVRKEK